MRLLTTSFAFLFLLLMYGVHNGRASMDAAEHRLVKGINVVRVKHGLRPLHVSPALSEAARQHSVEMSRAGFFAHESRDGTPFWRRIESWYQPTGRRVWVVGENILWEEANISPWKTVVRWMHSPPHRANLLNSSWRDVGIAMLRVQSAPGVYGGDTVTIVTTDFGVRG